MLNHKVLNCSSLSALPILLNLNQAREVLGISQSSLLRFIKKNELPHIKLGRRVLIPKDAIEKLIKSALKNSKMVTANDEAE